VEQKFLFGFWNKMLQLFIWNKISEEQISTIVPLEQSCWRTKRHEENRIFKHSGGAMLKLVTETK